MRARPLFVASWVFGVCLSSTLARAQDEVVPECAVGSDTSGTIDSPPEMTIPALPEGYVASVRAASNADRRGPGPGERVLARSDEEEPLPPLPASDPFERVLLEAAGAGAGIALGWGLAYAAGELEGDDDVRVPLDMIFSWLLVPTMTSLGGVIAGGRGNWGGAFLGETVGIGVGALFALLAIEERSEEGMWTALMLLPAVAAIAGIEVQHALRVERYERRAAERASADVSVAMTIAPARGGATLIVGGTF